MVLIEGIQRNDVQSLKGTGEEWNEKLAIYPSLKKLDEDEKNFKEAYDGREERMAQFVKNHKDLENFKNNPTRIVEVMDEYANQHEFMVHLGSSKGIILQNLILENKPRVLVELGGYCGYSAMYFAEQMRGQATAQRPVHVWSIEKEETYATIARDLISLSGLQDYITVLTGTANDVLRKLQEDKKIERIDFLFLDHAEDEYEFDAKLVLDELKLLPDNSVIVANSLLRPGAPKYREYVNSHERLRTRTLKGLIMPGEFEDELEISKLLPAEHHQETEDERRGVGMGVI